MIYDHSSDLFSIRLHNDDNQDFDLAGNKQFHQQVIPSRQKSGRSVLVIITGFDSTSDFLALTVENLFEVEGKKTITD